MITSCGRFLSDRRGRGYPKMENFLVKVKHGSFICPNNFVIPSNIFISKQSFT